MFKRTISQNNQYYYLALSILFTLPANSVSAAGGLSIYTTYPSIAANQAKMCNGIMTLQ